MERQKVKSLSRVQLFATLWAIAYQDPPSMGFSRQDYWSRLPFPSPADLPHLGIEPRGLLHCRQTLDCLSYQGSPGVMEICPQWEEERREELGRLSWKQAEGKRRELPPGLGDGGLWLC